jgi:hypothetical protein
MAISTLEVVMANRIVFSTSHYELAHGRETRALDCRAFMVGGEVVWITPTGSLAECKKRLLARLNLPKGSRPITAIVLP